jgi:hypothetical protein
VIASGTLRDIETRVLENVARMRGGMPMRLETQLAARHH